jgi:hypothetical protein
MKYLLMIWGDESLARAEGLTLDDTGALSPASEEAMAAEYGSFISEMTQRGVLQGGERLRPPSESKTVRIRGGKVLKTDGPFAETKEQMGGGGYFVIDCKDLDEALEIAGKIPDARFGTVEVRPIWEM